MQNFFDHLDEQRESLEHCLGDGLVAALRQTIDLQGAMVTIQYVQHDYDASLDRETAIREKLIWTQSARMCI